MVKRRRGPVSGSGASSSSVGSSRAPLGLDGLHGGLPKGAGGRREPRMATGITEDGGELLIRLLPKDLHMAVHCSIQAFRLGALAQPAGHGPEQADGQQDPSRPAQCRACQAAGAQSLVVVGCPLIQHQELALSNALQLGGHGIARGQGCHAQQQKQGPRGQADLERGR